MTLALLHRKMFDVGDLLVLTFGSLTLLKTGVIKWPLKLYVRFMITIMNAWIYTARSHKQISHALNTMVPTLLCSLF